MDREVKQEASLPVQSRIDIRTLANLVTYWESNGVEIRSMSQLLSWSVELCQHLLSRSDMLPSVIKSVGEAHTFLQVKKLYQPGLRKRGHMKAINAMMLENLRVEGIDPESLVKPQYNIVHNTHSVNPPNVGSPSSKEVSDKWDKVFTAEDMIKFEIERKREEGAKLVEEAKKVNEGRRKEPGYDKDKIVVVKKEETLPAEVSKPTINSNIEQSKPVKVDDRARAKTVEQIEVDEERIRKEDRELEERMKSA